MSKYAFLINSSLDEPAPLANTLEYARKLDDAGHDVVVFFDGAATQWIPELETNEDLLPHDAYADVRARGLIRWGVWFLCFLLRGRRAIEKVDITIDGDAAEHGPDVGQLAEQGYQLLTIG
jgi:hypothetical protein